MKKFLVASVVVIAAVVLGTATTQATILVNEAFNYANGDITTVSGGTWTSFSGTTALNVLNGAANPTGANSMDDSISLGGTHSSDQIYAGFDADVLTWSPANSTGYFALFKDASTFNFFARTYVTNVTGGVEFGISTGATQPPIWSSAVALGATDRVVISLDQTGATLASSLWLNGTLVGTATATNASGYGISAFALRQSNSTTEGSLLIDNLQVATTFAEANTVVPEPSTMALLGFGLVSMLALGRRHVSRK